MLFLNKIKNTCFKTYVNCKFFMYTLFYEIWLWIGTKLYFLDIVLGLKEFISFELMFGDRKVSKRQKKFYKWFK